MPSVRCHRLKGLRPAQRCKGTRLLALLRQGEKESAAKSAHADTRSNQKGSMDKHQHVFDKFIQFENLYDGYLLARRNKRFKSEVLSYPSCAAGRARMD